MKKRILSLILCACLVLSICPALNIAPLTKVYAAATSQIHNFTDDGFTSDFYTFAGGQVTNGKHGTYTYDFGSGTETLNYALKFDSGGSVEFTPAADGTVTIAVAAQSAERTVVINDGKTDVLTVSIDAANQLYVDSVAVSANVTYTVKRSSGESGLFYIAYVPTSSGGEGGGGSEHTHDYTGATVTYAWADDYSSCTASRTCIGQGCGNVDSAVSTAVMHTDDTATCIAAGEITYTATFADATTWGTATETVTTSATGKHTYVDGVCTVDGCGALEACNHAAKRQVAANEPTCTEAGNVAHWYCGTCGKYFLDEACTEIVTAADVRLEPQHTWGAGTVVVEPTCVRIGTMEYMCTADGCEELKHEVIPAAHQYGDDGKCICTGGVLEYCGATSDTLYIKDFTDETLTTSGDWLVLGNTSEIKKAKDSEYTATYNGNTYKAYLKMNDKMQFVLNTLADDDEQGIDGDGILILVTKSREGTKSSAKLTTLNVSVNGGEAITVGVPRDGILVLGVNQNSAYTITKNDVENPLFYVQYIPGAKLTNVTEEDVPGEGGGSTGDNNDGIVTITAEITDEHGNILSQYTTLAAALAAVQNGQTVCLLEANSEQVTVGSGLAVRESFKIHFHATFTGQITPATGVTATPTGDGYTVSRDTEPEPVDPTDGYVAYIDADKDDVWDEGETLFKTVSAALAAAGELVEGETTVYVCLLRDAVDTYVIIPVGVLLDLNACTLTADYVVGFNGSYLIADIYTKTTSENKTYGKLVVDDTHVVLGEKAYYDQTREIMPFWDPNEGCFVFAKLGVETADKDEYFGLQIVDATENEPAYIKFMWRFNGGGAAITDFLADGGEDNNLRFVVRLIWTTDKGEAYQDYVFNNQCVGDAAVDSKQALYLMLTEYEELGIEISTLKVNALIISGTGVVAESAECDSEKLTG